MGCWSLLLVALAHCGGAQAPVATSRDSGVIVGGMVTDSITHAPLHGAMVQFVTTDAHACRAPAVPP